MYARRRALLYVALASAALTAEDLAAAPRYRMVLDSSQAEQGVKTVSLVKNPAIQRGWVALSAVESTPAKHFHLSEATEGAHRQVLTGPALIPGQEILRLDAKGEPFYITFDEATIEGTARQFAAQGHHNSTNQDHATALAGNVVYESWLVADPAKDKAAALGIDVPAGTWMLSVHIPDADYWQNEVVTGNKLGFSIEGLFTTEQLTLSAAQPTALSTVKNWFQKLSAKLAELGGEKAAEMRAALGLEELADGRSVSIDDATGAVSVVDAEGNSTALADGEYELKSGGKLMVKDGVKATEEVEAAKEGATDDKPTPPPAATGDGPADKGTEAERLDKVEKAVEEILSIVKDLAPKADPATEPAGEKLAAALHKVALADLGPVLTSLALDAIDLEDGTKLTYNAITRQLTDKDGALVKSGYFAAADGSYFSVSTDQYIYEISKPTYDSVYLQSVELAGLKSTTPAASRVKLNSEQVDATSSKTQKVGLSATAHLRALQKAGE